MHGFIDIPSQEIQNYMEKVKTSNRETTCKKIPQGRFNLTAKGLKFAGLICSPYDMGGEATGIGAEYCMNCVKVENVRK